MVVVRLLSFVGPLPHLATFLLIHTLVCMVVESFVPVIIKSNFDLGVIYEC